MNHSWHPYVKVLGLAKIDINKCLCNKKGIKFKLTTFLGIVRVARDQDFPNSVKGYNQY